MTGFSVLPEPLASGSEGIDDLKEMANNSHLSFKFLNLDEQQHWVSSSDRFIVRGEVSENFFLT